MTVATIATCVTPTTTAPAIGPPTNVAPTATTLPLIPVTAVEIPVNTSPAQNTDVATCITTLLLLTHLGSVVELGAGTIGGIGVGVGAGVGVGVGTGVGVGVDTGRGVDATGAAVGTGVATGAATGGLPALYTNVSLAAGAQATVDDTPLSIDLAGC